MLALRRPNILQELSQFGEVKNEMDRMFDDIFHYHGMPTLNGIKSPQFSPALDFIEKEKEYLINLEIPGIEENNIEINLTDDETLVIKGEKTHRNKEENDEFFVNERYYGTFRRELSIPANCKTESIGASYKNGVLTLTLPKLEEVKKEKRKIEIKNNT